MVGGLGFGATVRGVLDVVAPDATILVVEKVEAVIELVRGPLAYLAERVLDDARVTVVPGDVRAVLAQAAGDVDLILLDVDNGPHWASFRSNARLYSPAGLADLKRALFAGGALRRLERLPVRLVSRAISVPRASRPPSFRCRSEGACRARAYVGSC